MQVMVYIIQAETYNEEELREQLDCLVLNPKNSKKIKKQKRIKARNFKRFSCLFYLNNTGCIKSNKNRIFYGLVHLFHQNM